MEVPVVDVLVIDPNEDSRSICASMLKFAGMTVRCADSATNAFVMAAQGCPDMVIVDLNVPPDGAASFLRHIRDEIGCGEVPALWITSNQFAVQDFAATRAIGADRLMIKPVRPADLVAMVRRMASGGDTAHDFTI